MLEKAPPSIRDNSIIPLMVKLQFEGILKDIQDEYLYWDKVKYKSKSYKPEEVWNATKFERYLKNISIQFDKYNFTYYITDYMQRALHQFDLHIGGNLSSNIGIAETDKTCLLYTSPSPRD